MKSRALCIIAMTLLAALAIPAPQRDSQRRDTA
jgi:hypothetical protein